MQTKFQYFFKESSKDFPKPKEQIFFNNNSLDRLLPNNFPDHLILNNFPDRLHHNNNSLKRLVPHNILKTNTFPKQSEFLNTQYPTS